MYRWDKDDELYTESEAWEIACEEVDEIDMEKIFREEFENFEKFDFEWIWKHLSLNAKIELREKAADRYLCDCFIYVEDDEDMEENT